MSETKTEEIKTLPGLGLPELLPYLKPYRKTLIAMVFLGLVASLVDSIMPLFNRYALNHFIGENTLDTLGIFIVLYIVSTVIKVLSDFISLTLAGRTEMSVNRDLRNASFNHLQTLSFSYFNQNSSALLSYSLHSLTTFI